MNNKIARQIDTKTLGIRNFTKQNIQIANKLDLGRDYMGKFIL